MLDSFLAKQQAGGGTQKSHDFTIHFDPPIMLKDTNRNYEAALNKLTTMNYSWYNIRAQYSNNKLKWKKTQDSGWKTLTFTDGMYDYKTINDVLQSQIKTDKPLVRLYFDSSIFRTVLILEDVEIDFREGDFADLLGFEKKIFSGGENVSKSIPNITRNVDWVYIHCDLITREVRNVGADVLFSLSTSTLQISYPFSEEPRRLEWHPVNKKLIQSIRVYVTDGRNNSLDMNDMDMAFSLFIREVEK